MKRGFVSTRAVRTLPALAGLSGLCIASLAFHRRKACLPVQNHQEVPIRRCQAGKDGLNNLVGSPTFLRQREGGVRL